MVCNRNLHFSVFFIFLSVFLLQKYSEDRKMNKSVLGTESKMTQRLRLGVLVEQRYLTQAQPLGMCEALRGRGHQVTLIDLQAASFEMEDHSWLNGFDLIVPRGRSWALLGLLAWAESRGKPTINPRAAIAAVHNKAEMAAILAVNKVRTPHTFLGPVAWLASQVPSAHYPLILKPILGDNCRGLRLVNTPKELRKVKWPEPVALAQCFLPSDGYDLKLYGIGDEIWVVRKPSPLRQHKGRAARHHQTPAELLPLTPELRDLGRRCGNLFGLEFYGVDCIQTANGPSVIEVNEFPNYTSVPEAGEKLAEYLIWRAQQGRRT